jgi:hypothetical protein
MPYISFSIFQFSLMTFEDSLLDDFAREFQKSVYSDLFPHFYVESVLMSILGSTKYMVNTFNGLPRNSVEVLVGHVAASHVKIWPPP